MTDIDRVSTNNSLEQTYSDFLDKLMVRFTDIFEESLFSRKSNQSHETLIIYWTWNMKNRQKNPLGNEWAFRKMVNY